MNVDTASDEAFERMLTASPLPSPMRQPPRWRRRGVLAVGLTVVSLTSGAVYAVNYQPLQPRGWNSANGSSLKTTDDGIRSTGFLLDERPGSPARLTLDVKNAGRFSVTITGLDPRHELKRLGFSGQWVAPDEQNQTDVVLSSQLRAFPVTVRPGATVTVSLTFSRRASCVSGETSDLQTIGVASRALGVGHRLTLALPMPMYPCWPAKAHIGGGSTVLIG